MALFTLKEKTVDFKGMINRLEVLEEKITSSGHMSEGLASTDSNALKKKTVLNIERAPRKENNVPSGNFKPLAGVVTRGYAQQTTKPEPVINDSAKPYEGSPFVWKKLLGRMSSKRPILYNILPSLKVVFKDEKTWSLVSDNKF
jgi:hypothetical protein